MKKLVCLLLASVMAFALVGCGGETQDEKSEATAAGSIIISIPDDATDAQKTAMKKAQEYLNSGLISFSKAGLESILVSDGGVSEDAAEYAVNNCDVDWDAQAVSAAYKMIDISPMSESGLTKYLVSTLGFENEQAKKAVSSCDINWNTKAKEKAKVYAGQKEYTNGELVEKLKQDGFTDSQAAAGAAAIESDSKSKAYTSSVPAESCDTENNNVSSGDADGTSSENSVKASAKTTETDTKEASEDRASAVKKAKEYLNYTAFSKSGLVKQLEYEKFSTKDAKYGVDHCGADWNEQAVKKAKEYRELQAYSHQGLVDQLKFEGFTSKQAEHGVSASK